MTVVTRYRGGLTAPSVRDVARDLLVRALPPTLALLALGLLIGHFVIVPFSEWTGEDGLSRWLQAGREPWLDEVARTASLIGGVTGNAVLCVVLIGLIWLVSRQWWLATLPLVALNLHIFVHIVTSTWIARDRPQVEQLDVGQPTASFPSGHMGATTAQLLVMVLFLWSSLTNRALRVLIAVGTLCYLVVLGWSRVYLGMHHPSDVVWGAVNGVACGLIAWLYLRPRPVLRD